MSRRIKKLTPAMLKRIILEEKRKIAKEQKRRKRRNSRKAVSKEIKFLKETKEKQRQLVRDFKKLYRVRQILKKKLIKRL